MKPEYQQTRFLVEGHAPVPERFGVVTACNPDGVTVDDEQNKAATENLRSHLAGAGFQFFRVTGCSPDLRHQEPGFGIVVDDRDVIVELGRRAWSSVAAGGDLLDRARHCSFSAVRRRRSCQPGPVARPVTSGLSAVATW